jgi:hypothetical protein
MLREGCISVPSPICVHPSHLTVCPFLCIPFNPLQMNIEAKHEVAIFFCSFYFLFFYYFLFFSNFLLDASKLDTALAVLRGQFTKLSRVVTFAARSSRKLGNSPHCPTPLSMCERNMQPAPLDFFSPNHLIIPAPLIFTLTPT